MKLSGTTSQRVEVTATTSDGTATAPADYQAKTQVIVWAPNTPADELEKTFRVIVNPDSLDEANETVIVTLTAAQNAVIAHGDGHGPDQGQRQQLAARRQQRRGERGQRRNDVEDDVQDHAALRPVPGR